MYGADDLLGDDPRREFERLLVTRCRAGDPFALMLVDLDGFTTVSARFGAPAADLLLYEVASRLREMLNEQDVVMRSGNGEFAIFIRGMQQVQNAERLANELIERVERPITVSGTRFRLSASIGITLSPRQSGEWRLLLQDADEAVYDAKKQGRGHISISSAPPYKADA